MSPRGELDGAVDVALRKKGKKRHIAASVCSFLSSGPLVANSDLVLTAPSGLISKFNKYLSLRTFAPPLALPKINIVQVWHERYTGIHCYNGSGTQLPKLAGSCQPFTSIQT